MKRHELVAALVAAAGITAASGVVAAVPSDDDVAYRSAIEKGSIASLQDFVSSHPGSRHVDAALGKLIDLAANQTGHGTNSNHGKGFGGGAPSGAPGNRGNDKPVGNAGGYRG